MLGALLQDIDDTQQFIYHGEDDKEDSSHAGSVVNELDELGNLEMNELDNVLNFADNMATQLVFGTRKKM